MRCCANTDGLCLYYLRRTNGTLGRTSVAVVRAVAVLAAGPGSEAIVWCVLFAALCVSARLRAASFPPAASRAPLAAACALVAKRSAATGGARGRPPIDLNLWGWCLIVQVQSR